MIQQPNSAGLQYQERVDLGLSPPCSGKVKEGVRIPGSSESATPNTHKTVIIMWLSPEQNWWLPKVTQLSEARSEPETSFCPGFPAPPTTIGA